MEGNIARAVGGGGLEHRHQIPHTIQVNPITNPLQILENRLESKHLKTHDGGGEAGHADIGTDVHHQPVVPPFPFEFLENSLNRGRYIGPPKRLPLEESDDVLVGLLRQAAQISERVDEGVAEAFNDVGDDGVRLRALLAIERRDSVYRKIGSDGGVVAGGSGAAGEKEEDEDEDDSRREEEHKGSHWFVSFPSISHWKLVGKSLGF